MSLGLRQLVILLVGSLCIVMGDFSSAQAQEIRSTWETKKVLVINTNGSVTDQLDSSKRFFAIGTSEWYVKYEQQNGSSYTPVYEETWKLPALPDCYRPAGRAACKPGGTLAKNYLWGLATSFFGGNAGYPQSWTFEELAPTDPRLYTSASDHARGPAMLSGVNSDNIHNIVGTGSYGWSHARFHNGDRGGFVWSGVMMPLKWDVTGVVYD